MDGGIYGDMMAKRRAAKVPRKYTSGLSKSTAAKRKAQIRKRLKGGTNRFAPLAGDKTAKTRPSKYTQSLTRFRKAVSERSAKSKAKTPKNKFISSVAAEMKIPSAIVRRVYEKGEAAWSVGHRPGATQSQWAKARVYSFIRKGNTVTKGPDKDLYSKAKKAQRTGGAFKLR